ncbi:acyltransferase [Algibacillus agarilyticus]|uniref:acyltransferase n=1 Tax=Algibacillus agarilyticus TaxID=2234133 RepID=UPI000DD031BE|nr:acyltransferase [Algibacillus agarilyticus]
MMLSIQQTKKWLKTSNTPFAKCILHFAKSVILFDFPAPKTPFKLIYASHITLKNMFSSVIRILYWTPLFKSQTVKTGKHLYLYGGLPYLSGAIELSFGDNCRVSGQSTFSGRIHGLYPAQLNVGNNVDIGWMTTIASGSKVNIGNNVRIAGRAFLAGYPGHPIDPIDRAKGLPELDEQVGEINIKDDVWLATGVSIMAGVTIGRGTIVAAGSVVTHDLPDFVLAGGVPAKIIKSLPNPV